MRRSARQPHNPGTSVDAILEETNFSYAPNPVQAPLHTTSPDKPAQDNVSPIIESPKPVHSPSLAPAVTAASRGTEVISHLEPVDPAVDDDVPTDTVGTAESAAIINESVVPPVELQTSRPPVTRESMAASTVACSEQGVADRSHTAAVVTQIVSGVTPAAAVVEESAGVSTRSSASAASSAGTKQVGSDLTSSAIRCECNDVVPGQS